MKSKVSHAYAASGVVEQAPAASHPHLPKQQRHSFNRRHHHPVIDLLMGVVVYTEAKSRYLFYNNAEWA